MIGFLHFGIDFTWIEYLFECLRKIRENSSIINYVKDYEKILLIKSSEARI